MVKAREQVVAGTLHHLTLEAIDSGKKKIYEAKVWVKPGMKDKELQEFKHAGDAPSLTPSDLGVKKGNDHIEINFLSVNIDFIFYVHFNSKS